MNAAPALRRIEANGLEFAYLEAAPGQTENAPLVLVLHGFPDTAASFEDLLQRLAAAGFRACAPYLRGYAPSALAPDRDYSVLALGRDVIALIEHFGVPTATVVGHDWGAAAAYAAAALRPDRVQRIVAASLPHPRRFLLRPTRAQLRASHYMFKFQLPGWERRVRENDFAWLERLVRSWSPGWTPPEAYLATIKSAFAEPARLSAALGYYRALRRLLWDRESWRYLLRPIYVPAQVIYGERDACILPEMYRDMEHLFADDYELAVVPGCGHFLHLEQPQALADRVISFLRR
ncbi:MAG: alpha/beta hydrolase [Nevskia sp.]|nr:alpha/beta hydrolase [Nevskia sp.]